MTSFYQEMKENKNYAKALKAAKLKMIAEGRHPFLLGCFCGEWIVKLKRKSTMKKIIWSTLWDICFISFVGCTKTTLPKTTQLDQRPTQWAIAVKKTKIKNLYRVDEKLYRSAQPKPGDFDKHP